MKSKHHFVHWRITIPSNPSITQDRSYQKQVLSTLLKCRSKMQAKIYSFFCEHFQFHALVEIPFPKISEFEKILKLNLSALSVQTIPASIRYQAREHFAFEESSFPDLRKCSAAYMNQPRSELQIQENSKTHIHRFKILDSNKVVWPERRNLAIDMAQSKGFFKNPMQRALQ